MSGIEFFPKVDRLAGLEKPAANSASTAKGAAKKGASASEENSFANVLSSNKESDTAPRANGREERKTAADRLKENPANKTDMRRAEPVAARQPVRDAAPVNQKAATPINRVEDTQGAPVQEDSSALKQKAVVEFMGEMEAQFGVTAEEIMTAFSNLDEEALNGRPEDAMNQFLANLQIPPTQLEDAQKLYMKMVNETGDSMLNEKLAAGKAAVNFNVLSPQEIKKQQQLQSLDAMTDRFFPQKPLPNARLNMFADPMANGLPMMDPALNTNGTIDTQALGLNQVSQGENLEMPALAPNAEQTAAPKKDRASLFGAGALGIGVGASALKAASDAGSKAAEAGTTTSSAMSANSAMMTDPGSVLGESSSQMEQNFGGQGGEGNVDQQALMKQLDQAAAGLQNIAPTTFAAAAAAAAAKSYGTSGAASESTGGEQEAAKSIDAAAMSAAGLTQAHQTGNKTVLNPEAMMMQMPAATAAEKQENINELIKNAQVIMKKGGGEMNMQLRPEGLGSVQLKVMVQDGQVNVQMITENDAAKKLLENGINDLKQQLAANKLHVETMKVEAAADSAMQKFEQSMHDQQRDQQRQMASDFLGSFRDDRSGFHHNFMDRPMMGGYKGKEQKRRTIEPTDASAEIAAASSAKNRRQADGSRRLNLVA